MEKQWFVVQTYSGFENKVKANLERRIESMNMDEKIFRYGDVVAWLDQPDRSANVVSAIRERVPHVLGIASPKDNDANDWLKLGKLQYIIAWLRLERAAGGDVDAIQRIIYDYLDAVDAGEMTLTGETLTGETLEILRKFGAKIGVGI